MGRALLILVALAGVAVAEPGGRVVGKVAVTDADGKAAVGAEVVVYVVGYAEPPGTAKTAMEQKSRKFVPELLAITKDEIVSFPNRDAIFHNVFSQSTSRPFDLGSFKKDESKEKQFPSLGVVDVYCNIHPEMAATILVVPNQRHTRVGADGKFAIDGVRPGNWKVFAYTRRAIRPASAEITVTAGAEVSVEMALTRGAEAAHPNKFGEKYRDSAKYP